MIQFRSLSLIAISTFLLSALLRAEPTLLYSNDFEIDSGRPAGIQLLSGNHGYLYKRYSQFNSTLDGTTRSLISNLSVSKNYAIELTFNHNDVISWFAAVIVVRGNLIFGYTDANNYAVVSAFQVGSVLQCEIGEVVSGSYRVLASHPSCNKPDATFTRTALLVDGPNAQFQIGGKTIFNTNFSRDLTGRVGFETKGWGTGVFDSIRVYSFDASRHGWHNEKRPYDVNNDGVVSAIDSLLVINYLNSNSSPILPVPPTGPHPFYDTNRDGQVSPIDALGVINYLNQLQ